MKETRDVLNGAWRIDYTPILSRLVSKNEALLLNAYLNLWSAPQLKRKCDYVWVSWELVRKFYNNMFFSNKDRHNKLRDGLADKGLIEITHATQSKHSYVYIKPTDKLFQLMNDEYLRMQYDDSTQNETTFLYETEESRMSLLKELGLI